MPYRTISELPDQVKVLPKEAQRVWMRVCNGLLDKGIAEESAFRQAWTAVKNGWEKQDDKWVKKMECEECEDDCEDMKKCSLEDPTHSIKGIEIFASGKWNGDLYSERDLDMLVENFNKGVIKNIPLKVGHDNEQIVAGQPAVGIIERLYRSGKKLIADIGNIPKLVKDLINKKAYTAVSSEIAWNADFDGTIYSKLLTGVALLGAEVPAVNILSEIPAVYKAEFQKTANFSVIGGEIKMEVKENEIAVEEKVEEVKEEAPAEVVEVKEEEVVKVEETNEVPADAWVVEAVEIKEEESEVAKLKAELDSARQKLEEIRKTEEEKTVQTFAAKLIDEKKIVPAMKERIVRSLLDADNSSKKEYSIGDQKVEETSRENLIKLFEGLGKLAIYQEMAHGEGHAITNGEDKLVALAKVYSVEKKVSLKDAILEVSKLHPELVTQARNIEG